MCMSPLPSLIFRYMLYARPADLERLLAMERVTKWISSGMLQLVRWDAVPEHPGLPYWDQRLVYNHAVLSHLGRHTFLAMLDIDEYVSSFLGGGVLRHPKPIKKRSKMPP